MNASGASRERHVTNDFTNGHIRGTRHEFPARALRLSEDAQEDVAAADYRRGFDTRRIDRSGAGLGNRPVHLHVVLALNGLRRVAVPRLRRYVLHAFYQWKGRKR